MFLDTTDCTKIICHCTIRCGEETDGIVTKVSSDNKGIDVYNYGITDGTNVCQWLYTKGTNQRWIFEPCN